MKNKHQVYSNSTNGCTTQGGEITPSDSYSINVLPTIETYEEPTKNNNNYYHYQEEEMSATAVDDVNASAAVVDDVDGGDDVSEIEQEELDEKDSENMLHKRQESFLSKYIFRQDAQLMYSNKTTSFDFSYIFPPTPVVGESTSDMSDNNTNINQISSKSDLLSPTTIHNNNLNSNRGNSNNHNNHKYINNNHSHHNNNNNSINSSCRSPIENNEDDNNNHHNHKKHLYYDEYQQQSIVHPNTISTNRTIDNTFESSERTGDHDGDIEDKTTDSEEHEINMNNIYARNHIVLNINKNKGENQQTLHVVKGEKPDHEYDVKNVIKPLSKYRYKNYHTKQTQHDYSNIKTKHQPEKKEKQLNLYKKDPFYSCKSPGLFDICKSPGLFDRCKSPELFNICKSPNQGLINLYNKNPKFDTCKSPLYNIVPEKGKINLPKRNLYSRNNTKARESKEFLRASNFQSDQNKRTPEINNKFWYNQKIVE